MTDDDWVQDLAVNLNGPFYLCRPHCPIAGTGGNIINVSSIAGVEGQPTRPATALPSMAYWAYRALAVEYTADRVRVNAVCPAA